MRSQFCISPLQNALGLAGRMQQTCVGRRGSPKANAQWKGELLWEPVNGKSDKRLSTSTGFGLSKKRRLTLRQSASAPIRVANNPPCY
jgi:hypothetical protein